MSLFEPSLAIVETMLEQEIAVGDMAKATKLKVDFIDTVESLPIYKRQIEDLPDSVRQLQVDRLFAFFAMGAVCALDKNSNFNKETVEFETRRDLN